MAQPDEIKKLPSMEYRFNTQVVGEESGINWVGDFVYMRPTIGARSQINALSVRFNSDLTSLDPQILDINYALAHLRITLQEHPEWWFDSNFGVDLYDYNVILEIYAKCVEFERNWKSKIHGTTDDTTTDQDGDSTATDTQDTTKFRRNAGDK